MHLLLRTFILPKHFIVENTSDLIVLSPSPVPEYIPEINILANVRMDNIIFGK